MRVLFAAAVVALLVATGTPPAAAQGGQTRYSLANGCYALGTDGGFVVKDGAGGYAASAAAASGGEPVRMQATALGHYLLYGRSADYLGTNPNGDVRTLPGPGDMANWQVDTADGGFKISMPSAGKALAASGPGRGLELVDAARAGVFTFEPADGCATFPESDTNAVGTPTKGATPYGEVTGFLDAHMHMMAFEFLGGRAHCGRPWSPFGAPAALTDCPDHYPNGAGAVLENAVSFGNPLHTHDPVGWPTFKDWPNPASLTHEDSYYRWVERAWRGGLRTYVNLLVENKVLCEVYPLKQNSCDEMDAVRVQAKRIRELEDYIDAQYGGPGKGWFRIVTDPIQARRVINEGKLAVVLGIEVSEPFGCQEFEGRPMCDQAKIDAGLDEVYKLGVRDMEIVNKFDNALAGVAGDNGTTGAIVNQGNKLETGNYWDMRTCQNKPQGVNDREQPTPFTHNDDTLVANGLLNALGPSTAPLYPAPPHCNARGLTDLGAHLIRKMIEKKMIVDPDHLSVLAREQVMAILDEANYHGVVSSHSWSTKDSYPDMFRLGGVISPYAGRSTTFVEAWKALKPLVPQDRFKRTTTNCTVKAAARPKRGSGGRRGARLPSFTGKLRVSGAAAGRRCTTYTKDMWGMGWGADMNGFGAQGGARSGATNPVRYPFKSFDGAVTLDRQHSGQRVFDINQEGVANYGLFPDWVEDLRMIAGDEIVHDLSKGSEAYLQMWERADGIPDSRCMPAKANFSSVGLGRARLGVAYDALLRSAGQPADRAGRVWRYCADGQKGRVTTVLSPGGDVALIASTAPGHRARAVGPFSSASRKLGTRAWNGTVVRAVGSSRAFVYGVRYGKVSFVALAPHSLAARPARLRGYLRLAGLR